MHSLLFTQVVAKEPHSLNFQSQPFASKFDFIFAIMKTVNLVVTVFILAICNGKW